MIIPKLNQITLALTSVLEDAIFLGMSENILSNEKNLQEQLDRVNRHLSILYDISNAMRTTLELNHILYIILTGVTAHTGLGFNRAVLFLVNKKERILEGKMGIGPESGEHANEIWRYISSAKLDDLITADKISQSAKPSPFYEAMTKIKIMLNKEQGGLLANVYFDGLPTVLRPDTIAQYAQDPFLKIFKTTELVIMPLKAKDKVNGLIVADNHFTKKPIPDDDLKLFMMLANQAGLAIENSRLYEIVVHKSHTDSLTALWNHGFFQDTLIAEIGKAKEQNTSLCLAMIDIDNFKKLNDTWGHQYGDVVLTQLANIIKDSSRELDYVCRYGGEEFCIILTKTNKEQAYLIAERLREKIAQHPFLEGTAGQPLKLTVSIGIAEFAKDASSREDLIQLADKAMYTAKFIGKNTTFLAQSDSN